MSPKTARQIYTVLIVEDCEVVLRFLRSLLSPKAGFQTLEAGSCAEARRVTAATAHLDLLVVDLSLPDGFGTALVPCLKLQFPQLKVVFTSGTPVSDWPEEAQHDLEGLTVGSWYWMAKPFSSAAMRELIAKLLGNHG